MYQSAMGAMPPSGPPAPPMPTGASATPMGGALGGPTPPPMSASAEAQHRKKADDFARHAIVAFLTGKITRSHLADALADESAYDFPKWSAANVVHPSQAGIGAGQLPEPQAASPAMA